MVSSLSIISPSGKADVKIQEAQEVSLGRRLRQRSDDAGTERAADAATASTIRNRVKRARTLRTDQFDDTIYDFPSSPTPDPHSWNHVGGKKACSTNNGPVQKTLLPDDKVRKFAFERFEEHRWRGDLMEIKIQWDDGDCTWEPEIYLHEDALESLLTYWQSQNGRPRNPKDPDMYDIFAIRKHSGDHKKLFVEWVGYGPGDMTWASRTTVEQTALELVTQFFINWGLKRRNRPRSKR